MNSYWNNTGKHQLLYDSLSKALVPTEGYADTEAGEMLRLVGNVYYDIYNNGGANLDGSRFKDLSGLIYYLEKHKYQSFKHLLYNKSHEFMVRVQKFDALTDSQQKLILKQIEDIVDFVIEIADKLDGGIKQNV